MGFTNIKANKNILPKLGQKVGEWHTSFECQHTKHANIYHTTGHVYVIDQVVNVRKVVPKKKKILQFATIFHLLKQGRLMMDYECMEGFY
jgi:hypothetical protein